MDGLFRCGSPPVLFEVGGELVELRPMTLGVIGSCESFLMLRRRNVAEIVEEESDRMDLPETQRNRLRWKAYEELKGDRTKRVVTIAEMSEWMYTAEGVEHSAYWCLKDSGRKEFATHAKAAKFVRSAPGKWVVGFVRARDHASGLDLLASLDWPFVEAVKGAAGKDKPKFIAWRQVFRKFGEAYNFTPDQVNALTLYSTKLYACEEKELGGTKKVSYSDLMGMDRPKPRG